jgi:phosphatidate cytidylyltransferase
MLKTRVITAVALIIGFITALFLSSNLIWALLTLAVTLIGLWEWAGLNQFNRLQSLVLVACGLVFGLVTIFIDYIPWARYHLYLLPTLLILTTLFWFIVAPIWLYTKKPCNHRFLIGLIGLLLLLSTWLGLLGLHSIDPWLLIGVIATVSIADSAAYFSGKRFGKHKLAPLISPGKTWEGVAGAILVVTMYGLSLCYFLKIHLGLIVALWLLVALSVVGDLLESLLKRQAGLKDSGRILPGHGGVLDRIDGLIPTLPIALLLVHGHYLLGQI